MARWRGYSRAQGDRDDYWARARESSNRVQTHRIDSTSHRQRVDGAARQQQQLGRPRHSTISSSGSGSSGGVTAATAARPHHTLAHTQQLRLGYTMKG